MKKKTIKQHDITDCGAACLASIGAHYDLRLPIARIRQLASTDKRGTNLLGLIQAAEKLGFSAKGVRTEMEQLEQVPVPAIAHVIVNEGLHHFVVVYKVSRKHIHYMDPGPGKMIKASRAEWEKIWTGIFLLVAPAEDFQKGNHKVSLWRRFWALVQPHRSILLQALFGALIYTILGLSTSIYIQKITDFVLVGGNRNLLNLLSLGMLLILSLQLFIGTSKSLFILKTGQQIDAQLIMAYYRHLLHLPQSFFDRMRVGEIISRIGDAVKIRAFINDVAINLIVNVMIIVFSFILMFSYYWKLAVLMLIIIPLYAGVYWLSNRLNKSRERKLMEAGAELETQLVESLNAVRTIKQFGMEQRAGIKTEKRFVHLLNTGYTSALNSIFSGTASELFSRLFTILLLWAGAGFVLQKLITPGELLSFYALIGYFTGPASSLISMNKTIQNALIAADRLFEIIDLESETGENKIEISPDMIGDIRFEQVAFTYGSRQPVFESLNLRVQRGTTVGIVGESGSGKSTIAALLQKLYPLNGGHIYLGKYDLEHIDNYSLRRRIGIVPQQLDLFAGNIIDNIALGEAEPDLQRIIDICQELGLMNFLQELPNGLHTYVGENGVSLSGGQRQRLAIARALYLDPEILILDEATSALDSASEAYVQQVMYRLREAGKTILIIAHRLSTVMHADQIIVLEKGQISEQGTHTQLIEKRGTYTQLWDKQFPRQVQQYLGRTGS
ncbi:MAG TPA: peptidase domain-containing ABC transporter [Saprospiraceae bacterium]|nr:peptidase domain-containing ABC transporter [Saprospiraceae bacterium]